MTERSLPLTLSLAYDHGLGDLAEYFAALRAGRAVGSRCPTCGDVRVPPRHVCPDDGTPTAPVELSGTGVVTAATLTEAVLPLGDERAPTVFVLVAMDGAENMMFGRMQAPREVTVGSPVRLAGDDGRGVHPASAAVFVEVET